MTLTVLQACTLLALGACVALDSASFGQFMVSRPLIATVLAGAVVGSPTEAAQIGLVLEALHLSVLPIGAARYPEGGPAGVVAGAATLFSSGWHAMLTIVVFALFWGWVGGETTRKLRLWNGHTAAPRDGDAAHVERVQRRVIFRDLTRGAMLVAVGVPLLWALLAWSNPLLAPNASLARVCLGSAMLAGVASAMRMFGARQVPYAALGAAIMLVVLSAR